MHAMNLLLQAYCDHRRVRTVTLSSFQHRRSDSSCLYIQFITSDVIALPFLSFFFLFVVQRQKILCDDEVLSFGPARSTVQRCISLTGDASSILFLEAASDRIMGAFVVRSMLNEREKEKGRRAAGGDFETYRAVRLQ